MSLLLPTPYQPVSTLDDTSHKANKVFFVSTSSSITKIQNKMHAMRIRTLNNILKLRIKSNFFTLPLQHIMLLTQNQEQWLKREKH